MIEGVKIKRLKVIADERGWLMEMLRDDDEIFQKFGQVYLSVVYPGVVKGWHFHKRQTDHFVFVKGMAKVVLHDMRDSSATRGEPTAFTIFFTMRSICRSLASIAASTMPVRTPAAFANEASARVSLGKHEQP